MRTKGKPTVWTDDRISDLQAKLWIYDNWDDISLAMKENKRLLQTIAYLNKLDKSNLKPNRGSGYTKEIVKCCKCHKPEERKHIFVSESKNRYCRECVKDYKPVGRYNGRS